MDGKRENASSSKGPIKLTGLGVKKIDSPLAKYNSAGQLTCVVCNTLVKSEMVWTAHVNGKQHRDQVALLKRLKQPADTPQFVKPQNTASAIKRKGDTDVSVTPSPSKKGIPADFFDSMTSGPKQVPKPIKGILKNAPKISQPQMSNISSNDTDMDLDISSSIPSKTVADVKGKEGSQCKGSASQPPTSGDLPEGFFDDPKLDAKVRQIEFKDPVEEEWDKFQKEIHDEVLVSTAIQEEDQEESTAERQLEEIEEQMLNWNRVLQLEQKKEVVIQKLQAARTSAVSKENYSSSEDEAELDDLFDWRSKAT